MVTVEADAFCGPLLARRAAEAGVIYSLAYGDQPALICELVDWARTSGFTVTAAGRGHKWLPHFAQSTPETVWKYWGLNEEQAKRGGLNPGDVQLLPRRLQARHRGHRRSPNATGLSRRRRTVFTFPALLGRGPASFVMRLGLRKATSSITRARSKSASSLEKDGRAIPYDDPARACGSCSRPTPSTPEELLRGRIHAVQTDLSGRYSRHVTSAGAPGSRPRGRHLVASWSACRKEPTGCCHRLPRRCVIATAKRDLKPGEMLDVSGGGYTALRQALPVPEKSTNLGSLPLGLAHNVKLLKPIEGRPVAGPTPTWRWTRR